MKSLKEIEKYQNNIAKFKNQIAELEAEVAQDKTHLDELNESYKSLVVSGEVTKADKLYVEIEEKDKQYRAKSKRLKTMKESLKRVIIENCSNMSAAFDKLAPEYREVHADEFKAYQEAVSQLKVKQQEIEALNQEYESSQIKLSRFIDHILREHEVTPREYMGNVNGSTPFSTEIN